jgi:hypothetical protein
MRIRNRVLVAVVAATACVSFVHAQKPPKGGGGGNTLFPVHAEFRCPLTLECSTQDGIEGDTLGPYLGTTENGSPTAQEGTVWASQSYFTESGLFFFTVKTGRGRFVSFNFSPPIGAVPCASNGSCRKNFTAFSTDSTPHASRTYPVDALGTDLPNGFMSLPVGVPMRARFFMNFADPSGREILWTVRFDPNLFPGSTLLSVTRLAQGTWIIESSQSDISQLVSETTSKGKTVKVNEGYYTMPFKITITQ